MQDKREVEKYYIAVFDSRNHAMYLYQHLEKINYKQFKLIATPCKIKAGCSYSIKFNDLKDLEILLTETRRIDKKITNIYSVERLNRIKSFKKITSI